VQAGRVYGCGRVGWQRENLHSDRDVAYRLKALPTWSIVSAATLLLVVDPLFLAANLTKLAHGAWLPLLIGISAFTVMTTWQRGRQLITARREAMESSLLDGTPSQRGAVEGTGLAGRRGFAGSAGDRDEGELGRLDIPRLVRVTRAGGKWTANLTETGRHFVEHRRYPA
jgi:hypothetical protein